MAATLDPGTQAGIGAFAGLVEVSVNQVRRTHLVRVGTRPDRTGTLPRTDASLPFPISLLPQPLHTLKNFTQDGRVLPMNPAVWYRGWSAGVLIGVPMAVVQFGGSRSLERAFGSASSFGSSVGDPRDDDVPAARWSTRVASAALAGAVSGAVINPLDVCMTQQQKFGGSLRAVATRLARTHGASVATRAAWATMAREGAYACGYLCAAPWLRDRLDGHAVTMGGGGGRGASNGGHRSSSSASSSWNGFVAAASAGAAAGVLTQPVDTVKTLMQSNLGDGGRARAAGYVETATALVRRDGASALWRGTAPRAIRIASATFVLATVNERAGELAAGASWVDGVGEANPS